MKKKYCASFNFCSQNVFDPRQEAIRCGQTTDLVAVFSFAFLFSLLARSFVMDDRISVCLRNLVYCPRLAVNSVYASMHFFTNSMNNYASRS